eukprot:1161854-Pelagomonas_calceolata.AAC.3
MHSGISGGPTPKTSNCNIGHPGYVCMQTQARGEPPPNRKRIQLIPAATLYSMQVHARGDAHTFPACVRARKGRHPHRCNMHPLQMHTHFLSVHVDARKGRHPQCSSMLPLQMRTHLIYACRCTQEETPTLFQHVSFANAHPLYLSMQTHARGNIPHRSSMHPHKQSKWYNPHIFRYKSGKTIQKLVHTSIEHFNKRNRTLIKLAQHCPN